MSEAKTMLEQIYDFFNKLDRSSFIDDPEIKEYAAYDRPLAIGFEQTISQPSLVLAMTIELDLNPECSVLEIGTGSGYQTALLAQFSGHVYTVERIPELADSARIKLLDMGYENISFKVADGSDGWEEYGPYDRIMVTAAAGRIPQKLINQLKPGGKMIVPVGPVKSQKLYLLQKDSHGKTRRESLGDVRFVEFRGEYGW